MCYLGRLLAINPSFCKGLVFFYEFTGKYLHKGKCDEKVGCDDDAEKETITKYESNGIQN